MNILGVICEYNPFHKGHEYQLKTHKKELKADGVVCLMSGNFVQRGAPAVFDKWTRAKTAVLCGADLVLELPVVYSAQSANRFAFGAVSLLDSLGCIDYLSFGSECGDLDKLKELSSVMSSHEFEKYVLEELKTGVSYPKARTNALAFHYPEFDETLTETPNNILALEYIASLEKLKSEILPVTLKRNNEFLSASSIREKMESSEDIREFVPENADFLDLPVYDKTAFDSMVSYKFRSETKDSLAKISDVSEGLNNRFLNIAKSTFGADELSSEVKTKRYTKTRIDRIIINTLLGITDEDTTLVPQYARVLAFNDKGTEILNKMGKTSRIPIITKTASANPSTSEFKRMFEKDILATDIYALLTENKNASRDFTTSPIYVK
ncbi:MAG: nucleotidyltransferase [Clostridia bacterium]|nr:nucleotidyltransferase [Clostridia bacterium]